MALIKVAEIVVDPDGSLWIKATDGVIPVSGSSGGSGTSHTGFDSPTHTAPAIATNSTLALAANESRLYALLVNDSDAIVYLALGAAASLNAGIRLNANGGAYEMSAAAGNLYTGAIYAIHGSTGDKVVLVTEGI